MKPSITVIVSSYNRPRLLSGALDSVCKAIEFCRAHGDKRLIQVIVADDWSTQFPATIDADIAKLFAVADFATVTHPGMMPPPSAARQADHAGRCAIAINTALDYVHANTGYVCYLPDDDWMTPQSLFARADALDADPERLVVYGRLEACLVGRTSPAEFWYRPHSDGIALPRETITCSHNRNSFWSAEPITEAANRLDHGMFMHRMKPGMRWPAEKISGYDCPDAKFLLHLEKEHAAVFHSIDDVVVVKRYHGHGHRTDVNRREP